MKRFIALLSVSVLMLAVDAACPCADQSLCRPITTGPRKELLAFSIQSGNWREYDWKRLTTLAVFGDFDPQIVCEAHKAGARIVFPALFPVANLTNAAQRAAFIETLVRNALNTYTDGVNFDIESPIAASSPERDALTELVREATIAFHTRIPGSQVSVDVAWAPGCIDGRCYDVKALAEVSDFLFVMDYDTRSQIRGPCVASANSPISSTSTGLQEYLSLGIPPQKLLLGIPWYGYNYPCLSLNGNTCAIRKVPFRGVECSDAAGVELDYHLVLKTLQEQALAPGLQWDNTLKSPFFNFKDGSVTHQMWFDNPTSLAIKLQYAASLNLRGAGMWHVDALNYHSTEPTIRNQTAAMWQSFDAFFH